MTNNEGNNVVSGDFLRVLMALKKNIMRDVNVADVCQVMQYVSDSLWLCKSLSDSSTVQAMCLEGVDVQLQDVVCVLFLNTQVKSTTTSNETQNENALSMHSKNNAIIIGIVKT